jgi:hypothetical protein
MCRPSYARIGAADTGHARAVRINSTSALSLDEPVSPDLPDLRPEEGARRSLRLARWVGLDSLVVRLAGDSIVSIVEYFGRRPSFEDWVSAVSRQYGPPPAMTLTPERTVASWADDRTWYAVELSRRSGEMVAVLSDRPAALSDPRADIAGALLDGDRQTAWTRPRKPGP